MHLCPIHLVRSAQRDNAHVFLAFKRGTKRAQPVVTQNLILGVVLH